MKSYHINSGINKDIYMSKDNTTSKSFYDKYQILIHAVLILVATGIICWLSVLFMDFWNLCQKYWKIENTDKYWEDLISDANLFCEKYNSIPLARKIVVAFLDTQEEINRREKKI